MNPSSRPRHARSLSWWPPLGHPLALATLVVLAVRSLGLALHYFGRDLGGQPLVPMPMTLFPAAFAYHLAVLLAPAVILLAVWRLVPRARFATTVIAALVYAAAIVVGQVDFEMLRLVGRRFSPGIVTTYMPHGAFTSEIMLPLQADRAHTLASLALITGGLVALAVVVWRSRRPVTVPRWSWGWFAALVALTAYAGLVPARYSPAHRTLLQPAEVTFLRAWAGGERTPPPASPAALAQQLRFLVPAAGQRWTDGQHPLVHEPAGSAAATAGDPPDVIVIAIESLRASHLGFINPAQRETTPEFNALAAESVVFPHFIANGYPSAPGFFALQTGTLPHRTKAVTAEFPQHAFDALPARLQSLGYRRLAIWGGNAAMANQLAWAKTWYEEVDYEIEGNALEFHHSRGDAETFRVLREHLERNDRAEPARPQFIFVATAGTHGPFSAAKSYFSRPEDRAEAAPFLQEPGTDREENYLAMLRLLDRQIGRLREFLATRARRDHTVLIVCGDHGIALGESTAYDIRGYPLDGVMWTGALLHGPAALVGRPRHETFPASQVDIMPTVLALAGDRRPSSAMGVSLLAPVPAAQRQAIAVRDDGYRLDRDGWSLYVSAADPGDYFVHRSFQAGPRTRASDPGSPFAAADARELHAAIHAWSWVIEENRAWPGPR